MEFHALANLFPLIEGQAFEELTADVRANGVREPVWTFEGKILDGRNRWRAAQAAEKTVTFREFDGADPVAFVISMNLRRRHLDESQRSLIASKLATLEQGRPAKNGSSKPLSQDKAAELMNVSRSSVKRARKVIEQAAPEVVQAVERGEIRIAAAEKILDAPKEQQAQAVKGGKQAVRELAKKQPKKVERRATPEEQRRERFNRLARELAADYFPNTQAARLLEEFFAMKVKPVDLIACGNGESLTKRLAPYVRQCQQKIVKRNREIRRMRRAHVARVKRFQAQLRKTRAKKRAQRAVKPKAVKRSSKR